MIWRPAYWADITAVMADLSDQHRSEYAKFGYPGAGFDVWLQAAYSCAVAHCLAFDGRPQAFFLIDTSHGRNMCCFGATKKAFERHHGMTRAGRKHLRRMTYWHGPLTAITASDHPMADRWIKLLGFNFVEQVGDSRVFSYA